MGHPSGFCQGAGWEPDKARGSQVQTQQPGQVVSWRIRRGRLTCCRQVPAGDYIHVPDPGSVTSGEMGLQGCDWQTWRGGTKTGA